MPKVTLRSIAFIIAFVSVSAMAIAMILLTKFNVSLVGKLVCFCLIVLLVYAITFSIMLKVVVEQIKPIYKTIYSHDISKVSLRRKLLYKPVENANKEVALWAEEKEKELTSLYKMEQFRKEFVGNVSHELKTPIFNIQGYVLTLLDGALDDPEIAKNYLERTEKSVNRLIAIIEDLDTITKLETQANPLKFDVFDIVKLVEETLESLEMNAKKRGIKLSYKAETVDKLMVDADRQKISQVLVNLIANSIKYGVDGGHTEVSFSHMPGRVLVEVKDNGVGIDQKDITRIFERFYRVDKHRSRETGGSGLGLSIVKHIIESHGQTINVRSKLGKGTTFVFTLNKAKENRSLFS